MVWAISTPGLVMGQTSSSIAGQTIKTGTLRAGLQVAGQLAKWGAYAYFGVEALKYGFQQLRPEMVATSAASAGAWYGPEGMGGAYARGVQQYAEENAMAMQEAQARAYQQYSPVYQDVATQKIWAEQQARYQSNIQYPTFPVQNTEKANTKMPYTHKIL